MQNFFQIWKFKVLVLNAEFIVWNLNPIDFWVILDAALVTNFVASTFHTDLNALLVLTLKCVSHGILVCYLKICLRLFVTTKQTQPVVANILIINVGRSKRQIIPNDSFLRQLCELNSRLMGERRSYYRKWALSPKITTHKNEWTDSLFPTTCKSWWQFSVALLRILIYILFSQHQSFSS